MLARRSARGWAAALVFCSALAVVAGGPLSGASGQDAAATEQEAGIPVTDPLVIAQCGGCHVQDDKGNMSRISWVRTTPEGWSQVIRRMVRQNGLEVSVEDSRAMLKYLSARHGLAPEEAKPVMYVNERRQIDETNIPNESVRGACAACHGFGQPLSWRRSKLEWSNLQDFHVALYSQADAQFRRPAPDGDDSAGKAKDGKPARPQGDVARDYLVKTAPLHTPEWTAWQARMKTPDLAGRWLISASAPGQGSFVGEMVVTSGAAADEFKTAISLRSLKDGSTVTRSGSGLIYAGYSWRGRSTGGAPQGMSPNSLSTDAREALWFTPDQTKAEGRWFWGEYQEFGFDVKLTRASGAPTVAAVAPGGLKAGARNVRLRIIGDSLPAGLKAADVDLGAGVRVGRIVSQAPGEVVAEVTVAADAVPGPRDVRVAGATLERAVPVYRRIDYLKVTPEAGAARLGGVAHAKGYQQFEAIGYDAGPDGKAHTDDDVRVGVVDADWSIDEFMSVFYDDDHKYVGTLDRNALFTPAEGGPNPARRFGRNNYGDVWITATAKTEKDGAGKALAARSFLRVMVPAYIRWDHPEVTQ